MTKYEKILIIGAGGGREHALGWKITQSPRAGELYFARGNGGTASLGKNLDIKDTEIEALISFCKAEGITLVLVCNDDALALGAVDQFTRAGIRAWGPSRDAAEIEWSKGYAKEFMARHNLPTAKFKVFKDYDKAKEYVLKENFPLVLKASGLALGKGVVICQTQSEAESTLYDMMVKKTFGEAGMEVVIEEFMTGPEISTHAFSDGLNFNIFPVSQDHKKIYDGDTGPNTGGMGTIAPAPFIVADAGKTIGSEIIAPALAGMRNDGRKFQGVIYPGLMLTQNGPKILEFNARFGDPETQTYMRLLKTDLLDIIDACIDGSLDKIDVDWGTNSACTIVLASGGYPGNYEKGKRITGIQEAELHSDVVVFHAGTKVDPTTEDLLTNGGRVLGVTAIGDDLEDALRKAYLAISKIHFEGMYYRKDIGKRALEISRSHE